MDYASSLIMQVSIHNNKSDFNLWSFLAHNWNITFLSVRSHMLNVDVAIMFNPETEEMLRKTVEDCDQCAKKVASLTTKGEIQWS